MSKNKINTRNKISKRNRTNTNGTQQTKNIFQLIEDVPKTIHISYRHIDNHISFAENLILFLQKTHPKELYKLSFNPESQNINDLIGELSNTIIDLRYQIVFENDCEGLKILYPIWEMDFMWYIVEYSWMDIIHAEELKIGYTHLVQRISEASFFDITKEDFDDTDECMFCHEFDMIVCEYNCFDDNDKFDPGMLQEREEEAYAEKHRLQTWKEKFLEYKAKDINHFYNYKPKNDEEKRLFEYIWKGLNLDFTKNLKFMNDSNIDEDGGYGFDQSIYIGFDISEGVEEGFFESVQENANNSGASNPSGWYFVSDGKVKNMTSEQDIKDLKENFQYLEDLYSKCLNLIKR